MLRHGLFICLLSVGWGATATAEDVYVLWQEPTASGTLAFTTVYWCLGEACGVWQTSAAGQCVSRDGNGGRTKKTIINVPLQAGELPRTVRVKVTATDTAQNETAGAISTHTFNAQ